MSDVELNGQGRRLSRRSNRQRRTSGSSPDPYADTRGAIRRPLLALLVVSAVWGSHPVVGKLIEHQVSPLALTVWRFTIASVCYLPWAARWGRILRQPKRVLWRLLFTALFWCIFYPLFYYHSLTTLSPIDSLLIVNTAPLLAALFAFVFLRERLRGLEWLGIAVAFGGVFLLMGRQVTLNVSLAGIGFAALATVSFATYTVLSRKLFQELALFDVLVGTTMVGAVGLWLYALVTGQGRAMAAVPFSLDAAAVWQLLYIGIAVSMIAYILYGYGLGKLPAGTSSAITFYPQAFFAALIQWVWLSTVPTALTWVSAACILAGTFLMSWRPRRQGSSGA